MKMNMSKKLKALAKCVLCMVLCYWLITILLSWNRVMHFKNYIYASHPMSSDAYSRSHFTVADMDLHFSNRGTGISAERYTFCIIHKMKDSSIARPQESTIDTLGAFFTPCILNERKVAIGLSLLDKVQKRNGGNISNAFGLIRFSSPLANPKEYHEMELYNGGNPNSFVVQKSNTYENASIEFWDEEDTFYTLLDALRKWELGEYRTSIFRFDNEELMVNTYYGFGSHVDSTVVIQPKTSSTLVDYLHMLFLPYDISKAKFDCSLMTYEIDSTNVTISFDESVEISRIDNYAFVSKDVKKLNFTNWGICKTLGLADAFHQSYDGKSKTVVFNGWDLRDYKQDEALTFNVKFLESSTIQWFRLFFLTTIIAYLLAIIVKMFYQLFKNKI